jgi:hypothetical protein
MGTPARLQRNWALLPDSSATENDERALITHGLRWHARSHESSDLREISRNANLNVSHEEASK